MTALNPNRQQIMAALGLDDLERLVRWFVESRENGWHPGIWSPAQTKDLEEKCLRVLPRLDEFWDRRTA